MKKRILYLVAVLCTVPILAFVILFSARRVESSPLKTLWPLPAFSLSERSGKSISLADLKGKVWIANFIFTSCSEQCPMLTTNLKRFSAKTQDIESLRVVSFTVDPKRDTPKVLSDYADKLGADKKRWFFVTGSATALTALIAQGFKVSAETGDGSAASVTHSAHLVLVDKKGNLRGYYDGMDNGRVDELIKDVRLLAREAD